MSTSPPIPGESPEAVQKRGSHPLRSPVGTVPSDAPLQSAADDQPTLVAPASAGGVIRKDRFGDDVGRFASGELIAGRFRVIRYIAHGGMGEVYEVEDLMLQGVHVALKVIRPDIARDASSARRFEQEVLLARKVTHPNLCPIYDIARSGDPIHPFLFLTMRLLAGETLSDRLQRSPKLSRDEAISIARQLAAGIAALHAAGIVHRDIKPNNLMLEGSGPELSLSIMDFGLARIHQTNPELNAPTVLAGTPGFMAPEMMRSEPPSPATDLYAVGVLLREVFHHTETASTSASSRISRIALPSRGLPGTLLAAAKDLLDDKPQQRLLAFERLKATLHTATLIGAPGALSPATFRRLPRRALGIACLAVFVLLAVAASIPALRERARGILLSTPEKHVAVLPLEVAGGPAADSSQAEAVGDGLVDSLSGKLSNLDAANASLWVIPASEVRDRKVTTASAALREFGANLVVKPSFEQIPGGIAHLRLTLMDARKVRQIGYVDLEDESGNLSALEDQAVTRLARLMDLTLRPGDDNGSGTAPQREAYQAYLAGRGYYDRSDKPGNLDRAVSSFQEAIAKDKDFALAYALLTQAYVLHYQLDNKLQWITDAAETSRKAAELGSQLPATFVALAKYHHVTGNQDLAITEYQQALKLDPGSVEAVEGIAYLSQVLGKNAQAEAAYKHAIELRPQDWKGYNALGNFYNDTGSPKKAIPQFQHAIELTPDNSWPYINLSNSYDALDDPAMLPQAEEALRHSISLDPTFAAWSDLGSIYAEEGNFQDAATANLKALQLNEKSPDVWSNLASAYDGMHDEAHAAPARDRAIQLYEAALELNPQEGQTRSVVASLYAQQGRREDALSAIRTCLALAPSSPDVLFEIAHAYHALGDQKQAVRYLQMALDKGLSVSSVRATPDMKSMLQDGNIRIPGRS